MTLSARARGVVRVEPTLEKMQAVYQLSREGGNASPRFLAYVTRTPNEPGMVAYNPMAGSAALETVEQLIACDAEGAALRTAQAVVDVCEYEHDVTMAVAVRSTGLWTHRIATEVDERAANKARRRDFGIVSLWSREPNTVDDVMRESAAECVRLMWTELHGDADTLARLLAREGFAYAMAARYAPLGPYAASLTDEDAVAVIDALELLGDSRASSDMAGVLFGDSASTALGWTTLGVPDNAGYRWAIARSVKHIAELGVPAALRAVAVP